jgi:hypothetical protein
MDTPLFTRKKEDFVCEKCGYKVIGSGYTNHCPKCLYSKHVDINPGDRSSSCGGMMRPISLENKSQEFRVLHKCEICGLEKYNKLEKEEIDTAIELIKPK